MKRYAPGLVALSVLVGCGGGSGATSIDASKTKPDAGTYNGTGGYSLYTDYQPTATAVVTAYDGTAFKIEITKTVAGDSGPVGTVYVASGDFHDDGTFTADASSGSQTGTAVGQLTKSGSGSIRGTITFELSESGITYTIRASR